MKLTTNFTLEELIASDTAKQNGIDNTPDFESAARLAVLACNVLQPAREALSRPIFVSSGYRCPKLNCHPDIRGAVNSQHLMGEAADLRCEDIPTLRRLFEILCKMDCDQVLYERNKKGAVWIHVSYRASGNRNQHIDNYQA